MDNPLQTLDEATTETPEPQSLSAVERVAELLRGQSDPQQPPAEKQPADVSPPNENWDLKTVAERLSVEPAKLYESLKVGFDDGSEATLSALKDAYRPAQELAKAREHLLEENTTSKREVMEAQAELAVLIQHLGAQAQPELLREVSRIAEAQRAAQAEALLKALPEWKDPVRKAADWSDIRRAGREAGFSDAELRLAEMGYADHRMIRLALAASKVQAPATEKPAPRVAAAPKKASGQTPAQQFGQVKAAVKAGRMSPVAAVDSILKGAR